MGAHHLRVKMHVLMRAGGEIHDADQVEEAADRGRVGTETDGDAGGDQFGKSAVGDAAKGAQHGRRGTVADFDVAPRQQLDLSLVDGAHVDREQICIEEPQLVVARDRALSPLRQALGGLVRVDREMHMDADVEFVGELLDVSAQLIAGRGDAAKAGPDAIRPSAVPW